MNDNTHTKYHADTPPEIWGIVELTYDCPSDVPNEPWLLRADCPSDIPNEPWIVKADSPIGIPPEPW